MYGRIHLGYWDHLWGCQSPTDCPFLEDRDGVFGFLSPAPSMGPGSEQMLCS